MQTVDHLSDLTEIKSLLRILYAAKEPVDVYVLHEKYRLSPGQLSRAVRALIHSNVVAESEAGFIILTKYGRKWIMMNRRSLFSGRQYWKDVPDSFRRTEGQRTTLRQVRLRPVDLRALRLIDSKE